MIVLIYLQHNLLYNNLLLLADLQENRVFKA